MSQPLSLTIIVHTRNSAATLEHCLASLPQVDQLLVVDMQSTDASLLIARQFHAQTMSVADTGYVEPARELALTAATQPWILIIDADEALPEAALQWLPDLLQEHEHDIYALPRRNIIFGRPLEHTGWWPDYQVRLFRKGSVHWPDQIHAQPQCSQKPYQLPATAEYAIVHQNYQHIAQFIDRMNRYTTIEVANQSQHETDQWLPLLSGELMGRLLAEKGWQDQEPGLAISILQSMYPVVTALKCWEERGFPSDQQFETTLGAQLKQFSHEVAYWHATYQISRALGIKRFYWQIRRKLQL